MKAEFLNGLKSPQPAPEGPTPCFYMGRRESLKFFNLSTREPSRGCVTGGVSSCLLSYVLLNILNYLKLYIGDQGVSLSGATLGDSPDLEQLARHRGGRRGAPVFAPLFPLMFVSDSTAIGPVALPPLHADPLEDDMTALPKPMPGLAADDGGSTLSLDLGTTTGWAMKLADSTIVSGTMAFRPGRYEGGGMRFLRFRLWLDALDAQGGCIGTVYFEEVRRHAGTDAAHIYGGFLAHLTAWCEMKHLPYQGVPVGTIKRHVTGKGNAGKEAVIAAIRARGFAPKDDNEADALAILLWAIDTDGGVR